MLLKPMIPQSADAGLMFGGGALLVSALLFMNFYKEEIKGLRKKKKNSSTDSK